MTTTDRLAGVSDGLGQKAPVACATTAPVALSGLQKIDGVVQVEGTRTLVKNQVNRTLNGIWNASSGPWTRALDFNGVRDIVDGTQVSVARGSQAGIIFRASILNPGPIGQADITFAASSAVVSSAPWTEYTPIVTPATGELAGYTASARFQIVGKRLHLSFAVIIAPEGIGTASGGLSVSLPPGVEIAGFGVGAGRDNATSGGRMIQAIGSDGDDHITLFTYDNNGPARNGAGLYGSATLEIR